MEKLKTVLRSQFKNDYRKVAEVLEEIVVRRHGKRGTHKAKRNAKILIERTYGASIRELSEKYSLGDGVIRKIFQRGRHAILWRQLK